MEKLARARARLPHVAAPPLPDQGLLHAILADLAA